MQIEVRFDTVRQMLELCRELKSDTIEEKKLDSLLEHADYQIEFKRYGSMPLRRSISKDEFKAFFLNLLKQSHDDIRNERLREHYFNYKYLLENLDHYSEEIKQLETFTPEMFENQVKIALAGLPDDFKFDRLGFLFTIGIGNTFGYPYEHYSHFDIIQLIKNISIEAFKTSIAHEVHHIGFNQVVGSIDDNKISLEGKFLLFFAGEGLAVKYCNNAKGNLSSNIYSDIKPNLGLDEFSWQHLNSEFDDAYKTFKEHLLQIRSGKIKDELELQQLLLSYWMNPRTKEQGTEDIPKLKQLPWYSIGNEIWGLLHDVYGKEKVYEIIYNIDTFAEYYNNALCSIGREDLLI